jgi:hypothetical protein
MAPRAVQPGAVQPGAIRLEEIRPEEHSDGERVVWLATDDAERFARVGGRFFGKALSAEAVEIIDL